MTGIEVVHVPYKGTARATPPAILKRVNAELVKMLSEKRVQKL